MNKAIQILRQTNAEKYIIGSITLVKGINSMTAKLHFYGFVIKSLILILVCAIPVFTQINYDSVMQTLQAKPDTTKILVLTDLGFKYRSNNPVVAMKYIEKAVDIARKIGNKSLEAKSLNILGVVHRSFGSYDKSLTFSLNALGIAEESKDTTEMGYAENNISVTYRFKSFSGLALKHAFLSLQLFEKIQNLRGMSYSAINIGWIYHSQRNYPKALEYFNLTDSLRVKMNDRHGQLIAWAAIAQVYFDLGRYESAYKIYVELEKEYIAAGDNSGLAETWKGIGSFFFIQKDYKQALKYNLKSMDLALGVGNIEGEGATLRNLGLIYANLGKFSKGENHLRRSLQIAEEQNDSYLKLSCYKSLSTFYELKNDYKASLKYSCLYSDLKDTLLKSEIGRGIQEMEAVYNNEKNKKGNAILQKDIEMAEKQTKYWMAIIALLILITIALYLGFHSNKKVNKQLKELNAAKDKFFGIIAHDLKNPFNAIFGFTSILKSEYDTLSTEERLEFIDHIEQAGKHTYELLQNLLFWSQSQTGKIIFNPAAINLSKIVRLSVSVNEAISRNKNISLLADVDENLDVYVDEEMIKTVLRNLISNGIKFSREGGTVTLTVKKNASFAEVTVQDTGVGIRREDLEHLFNIESISSTRGTAGEQGTGLGLTLCKEFVEKNGGVIYVESKLNEGSKFIFTLPIISK